MGSQSIEPDTDESCVCSVLSAVAHAALWLGAHGLVVYLNPAAELLFCRRREEAFGLDINTLFGRGVQRRECRVLSRVRRGTDYYSEAERVVTGDGRELSVCLSARALILHGTFRGAVILVWEVVPFSPPIRLCSAP